ncbi:MAG: SPFH/Band 7/PHB domain protein [Firmicutes bacterium]|nr:SPFH/Band 7/PHB domain protein [Bacillota bacterium]
MLIPAIIIFVVIVLVLLVSSFRLVSQTNMFVVERLGGYLTTWDVGIHLLIPFVDRVVSQVSMKEQVKDFAPQPVITKDNLTMQIDSVVFFQVTDPKLFAYGVNNPIAAIENLSATTLRNIIGDLDLDQTLSSRDLINTKMRAILDEATDAWGIKVNRVEIKNIIPPKDITAALEKQLRAEREKRESILNAEGDKRAAILRAEGEAEAVVLRANAAKQERILNAEGEAEAIYKLKEAEGLGIKLIKDAGADQAVIQIKAFEALAKVADGQSTKIIIPSNIADLSSLILSATEIGQASKVTPKTTKSE